MSAEAKEFSDLWGELIHSNRWFRGATVFLSFVNFVLVVLVVVQATAPDPLPLVVRVDEVGRAEVVDVELDRATLDQNSPVVGFFLNQFVEDHFSRRHALRAERWQRSLNFLTAELQRTRYDNDVEELAAFVADVNRPEFFVENVVVRVIPQPHPPYRAEVFFDRIERFGTVDVSRERLTLSTQFLFADEVPSEALLINPLGLVLTYLEVQRQLVGGSSGG